MRSFGSAADERAIASTRIELPCPKEDLRGLEAGQTVALSGVVYTMRDAGHLRALEYLRQHGELPFGLAGQTLFYAGPTPPAAGRPLGSVGPTTASRMDFAAPELFAAGILATMGKGARSQAVRDACRVHRCVHFTSVGGVAALLATHVVSSEAIAWDDLGAEALKRLQIVEFPAFVGIDADGRDIFEMRAPGLGQDLRGGAYPHSGARGEVG